MKMFKVYAIVNLIMFTMMFLLCSFYETNFNISTWERGTRMCLSTVCGLMQIPLIALMFTIAEAEEREK